MGSHRPGAATYMIGSAFAFALMTFFVKLAGQRLPSQEIVSARAALTLVFTYAMLRRAGVPSLGHNRKLLLLRGLCGFCALSCVYYAVTVLPLAEATVIQYLHPTFTALLAARVLGERLHRGVVGSLVLGALGVLVVARPASLFGGGAALPTLGLLAALGGALLTSCAYVVVRKLGQRENPLVIVLYFPLVALPASIPTAAAVGPLWPTPGEWLLLLLVGISTQVGQLAVTHGLQRFEAGSAAIYSYTQVLFAVVLGAIFLDEVPSLFTLVGGSLIVLSAALHRAPVPMRQGAAATRAG
ncbi:MAG: DMT family transporter [Myxococcales bacterium]|nr:DMT family transporter [Myxococcales bacterium]